MDACLLWLAASPSSPMKDKRLFVLPSGSATSVEAVVTPMWLPRSTEAVISDITKGQALFIAPVPSSSTQAVGRTRPSWWPASRVNQNHSSCLGPGQCCAPADGGERNPLLQLHLRRSKTLLAICAEYRTVTPQAFW